MTPPDPIEAALAEMEALGNCQCSDQLCEHSIDAMGCRFYLISALRVAVEKLHEMNALYAHRFKDRKESVAAEYNAEDDAEILAALRGEK